MVAIAMMKMVQKSQVYRNLIDIVTKMMMMTMMMKVALYLLFRLIAFSPSSKLILMHNIDCRICNAKTCANRDKNIAAEKHKTGSSAIGRTWFDLRKHPHQPNEIVSAK